ncbi:IS21-like element helper ATPase IstB [Haloechinothrix salitolerans]|uniref:IS21-like element helper ATPase IstB n=1 Tax=Haloechinothrix salitolerans TaxID=926830 RepID=A0ABW2BWJ3_9PSEU
MTATEPTTVAAPTGDPLDEVTALSRRLKLPHLRKALAEVIPTAKAQRWDPTEVVRVLLAEEAAGRDAAALRTRRKRAGFPSGKTFDVWDESASSISRATQQALRSLEWVQRRENLCVCGPSGTGKSHFCEALGQHAIDQGMAVAWFTIEDLGALVRRHRADDTLAKALTRLTRADLIIVDDIGMLPVSSDAAEGFYRLVDSAYERRSLTVSSNLHPSGFDEIMPKTLATATVDRLLHHAHVCVTSGESFRLAEATNGKGVTPLT